MTDAHANVAVSGSVACVFCLVYSLGLIYAAQYGKQAQSGRKNMCILVSFAGWWRAGAELRKIHFAEEWNELHHLQVGICGHRLSPVHHTL